MVSELTVFDYACLACLKNEISCLLNSCIKSSLVGIVTWWLYPKKMSLVKINKEILNKEILKKIKK